MGWVSSDHHGQHADMTSTDRPMGHGLDVQSDVGLLGSQDRPVEAGSRLFWHGHLLAAPGGSLAVLCLFVDTTAGVLFSCPPSLKVLTSVLVHIEIHTRRGLLKSLYVCSMADLTRDLSQSFQS